MIAPLGSVDVPMDANARYAGTPSIVMRCPVRQLPHSGLSCISSRIATYSSELSISNSSFSREIAAPAVTYFCIDTEHHGTHDHYGYNGYEFLLIHVKYLSTNEKAARRRLCYHAKWAKALLASAMRCISSFFLMAVPSLLDARSISSASFWAIGFPLRERAALMSQRYASDTRRC